MRSRNTRRHANCPSPRHIRPRSRTEGAGDLLRTRIASSASPQQPPYALATARSRRAARSTIGRSFPTPRSPPLPTQIRLRGRVYAMPATRTSASREPSVRARPPRLRLAVPTRRALVSEVEAFPPSSSARAYITHHACTTFAHSEVREVCAVYARAEGGAGRPALPCKHLAEGLENTRKAARQGNKRGETRRGEASDEEGRSR